MGALVPPLLSIAYSPDNPPAPRARLRRTVNFGLILSASFEEAVYEMDGKSHRAAIPCFSCIQPGWVCRQANPGVCEKLYFSYAPEHMPYFAYFAGRPEAVLMPLPRNPGIGGVVEEIFSLASDSRRHGNIDRLDLACARLVGELIIGGRDESGDADPVLRKVRDIAAYMDMNFNRKLDLGRLIARAGLSERTFMRRWRECFDLPPHAYLIKRRIDMSCRLLLETRLRVFQVAAEAGFDDPYYFSRLFRKHTSYSPEEYRQFH